jgi:hypothetical protein
MATNYREVNSTGLSKEHERSYISNNWMYWASLKLASDSRLPLEGRDK